MLSKQDLHSWATKEFATTLKVLRAYPLEKGEYKPSENSRTARDIARTFVFELYLLDAHLFGGNSSPQQFKDYDPDMATVLADFERLSGQIADKIDKMTDTDLAKPTDFAGHSMPAGQFAFMMILDQIHHRGQLTIYVRLAGGKIPSVYGPSADDPSTNL